MKGIIIYSSRTGNTKKMAEAIFEELKKEFAVEIASVEEQVDIDNYDFALLGGYTDQGRPDKRILKVLEDIKIDSVGLFATIGAMPDSDHGKEVQENMKLLLEGKDSLGVFLCPGYVDRKLMERIPMIPDHVLSPQVKEQMLKTSKESRYATKEELHTAAEYFRQNIAKNFSL